MCMEDVRIGRESGFQARSVTVAAGNNATAALPDPKRIRIGFATTGPDIRIVPQGIDHNVAGGWIIGAALPPLLLRIEDYGNLVIGGFTSFGLGAGTFMLVTEVSLERLK